MTAPETTAAPEGLKAAIEQRMASSVMELEDGTKLHRPISIYASEFADLRLALAALAHPPSGEPIPMVLHCPECGLQHIDAPEWAFGSDKVFAADEKPWTNPPHRSHLCAGCGHIWRPADVATVGVHSIQTSGKADSPSRVDGTRYAPPSGVGREAVPEASARPEGGGISIPARPANPQHVRADGWWSEDGLAWYHPAPHAAQAAAPTVHVVSSTTSSPQPASVPAEGEADVAALVEEAEALHLRSSTSKDAQRLDGETIGAATFMQIMVSRDPARAVLALLDEHEAMIRRLASALATRSSVQGVKGEGA